MASLGAKPLHGVSVFDLSGIALIWSRLQGQHRCNGPVVSLDHRKSVAEACVLDHRRRDLDRKYLLGFQIKIANKAMHFGEAYVDGNVEQLLS